MKTALAILLAAALAATLLIRAPAAPREERGTFGATITRAAALEQLRAAGIPASRLPASSGTHYVLLRHDELGLFTAKVRNHLYKYFGPGWDVRFNCFSFARHLVSLADLTLATEDWHAPVPRAKRDDIVAFRPATLVVCYLPHGVVDPSRSGHAVNLILTDRGPVWYDPQHGSIPRPTDAELATVYYPGF